MKTLRGSTRSVKRALLTTIFDLRRLVASAWRLMASLVSLFPQEWIISIMVILLAVSERLIHLGWLDRWIA